MRGSGRLRRGLVLGGCLIAGAAVATLAAVAGSGAATSSPPLDHFECYAAAAIRGGVLPVPFADTPAKVSLSNAYSGGVFTATPQSLQLHCTPTKTVLSSSGHSVTTPIRNAAAKLVCGAVAAHKSTLPALVTLTNDFGTGALRPTGVRSLCLPSWETDTSPPVFPNPFKPPNLDAYVCYSVVNPRGTAAFTPPASVQETDHFGTSSSAVGAPDILCVPSSETASGSTGSPRVLDPGQSLVCFGLPPSKTVAARTVYDKNQFGRGAVGLGRATQLCVPSLVFVPPTTTTAPTTTTTAPGVVTSYTNVSVQGPYDIATGSDGALWFSNYVDSTIGRITTDGTITNYPDATISRPDGIARGADGALWFANTANSSIGRITTGGTITRFFDPRIASPYRVAPGPDGNMWFTAGGANSVGSVTPSGFVVTYSDASIYNPQGITAGPDGALWFCNFYGGSIGRVTTSGMVSHFTAPTISYPLSITTGPDGALWFTNPGNNSIGRITTDGVVSSFTNPSISSPIDIVAGSDGALWFTNYSNNSIGRITTSGKITNYADPQISSPDGITAGPDGAIWFTNAGTNTIGRISV